MANLAIKNLTKFCLPKIHLSRIAFRLQIKWKKSCILSERYELLWIANKIRYFQCNIHCCGFPFQIFVNIPFFLLFWHKQKYLFLSFMVWHFFLILFYLFWCLFHLCYGRMLIWRNFIAHTRHTECFQHR